MKRFLYTLILVLCTIIVYGQKRTKSDEQIGEYQFISGGTQVIYIQPEPEKEPDTTKVKVKKENVKLEKDTVKKQPKVKKVLPTPFIGTSLGIGFDYYQDFAYRLKGNWSLDMAFYCTEKFAFGGYLKYHTIVQISGGFLFVHNFKNPNTAFLWGVGVDGGRISQIAEGVHPVLPYAKYDMWDKWNCGAEIRLGCQFNENWYIWFDMSHKNSKFYYYAIYNDGSYNNLGMSGKYYEDHDNTYNLSTSVSIGYKFNIKNKNKK